MPPTGPASAFIQALRPFQTSQGRLLVEGDQEEDRTPLAYVFKDGRIGCVVREDTVVEVLSLATGNLIGCKRFDTEINDLGAKVTCVKECWLGSNCHLLVGLETGPGAGMLCLLNFFTSKVIQAIEIPQRISTVEVVCTSRGDSVPGWALCEQLRYFCGVVAVGTICGYVYFLDLGLDEYVMRTGPVLPSGLCIISPRTKDVPAKRQHAMSKGQHLCMLLDEDSHHRSSFVYRKPDDSSIKKFLADDVSITCLQYIPQTGKLAVGFSFGCYQLWKLFNPVLEYSSRLEMDLPSVTHFAHQEPENDPKNFCYLWVARSCLPSELEQDSIASVSLYQLAYSSKDWFSGYGTFYKDLLSVGLRFDLDLSADLFSPFGQDVAWSRILGCYTMQDPYYNPPNKEAEGEESFEETGLHGPDLSLSVVIWEAQEAGSSTNTRAYLGLFDMNRWYHAQMPTSLRVTGSMELCSYFAFYSLDQITDTAAPDSLLAVHVGYDTVRKFINNAPLAPEQHFYPSSLAFEAKCVLETSFVSARFQGTQRQVLMSLQQQGPNCLLAPAEMFNLCVYAGLLPRTLSHSSLTPQPQQLREALLSLCLDHNLVSFIKTCITQWADGDFTPQGCTLKFLLDWSWARVGEIKDMIDKTCVPLYDWSGVPMDQRALQTLHHCHQKLSHMPTIFQAFLAQSSPITDQGVHELSTRLKVIELVLQQLTVVLWFIHRGLLPENDEVEELSQEQYAYPASSLYSTFSNRRMELKKLHSNVKETDLLMIDGLMEHMGPSLSDLWDSEGGNGLYPPPSLHALINMYLLEDIPLVEKHCVVLYLLLDIVSAGDMQYQEQFSEKISCFGQAMSMPESLVRLVHGFWLLDHKDFQGAEVVLTQPMVDGELGPWQRHRVVKALLYQGESKLALRYIRSRPITSAGPEDIKLQLTVLLANSLTARAWEYQRQCRDESNQKELLYHLFLGCQQTKTFVNLLELPLSETEEHYLIKYLQENGEPNSLETLVMYYLQRGRYIEGIRLNETLKHRAMGESNPRARELAAARNALVEGYLNILPAVQRKMVFERLPAVKEHHTVNRIVPRPKPLSTVVSRGVQGHVISQSTLIQAMMEKVGEIGDMEEDITQTKRTGRKDRENSLFINTPTTPKRESQTRLSQSIVFPRVEKTPQQTLTKPQDEEQATLYPWKKLTDASLEAYSETPLKGLVAKRRMSRYMSAGALSLLKTPPVLRKPSCPSTGPPSAQPTPQSILKVRRLIQRSPSPKIVSSSPSTQRTSQERVHTTLDDSMRIVVGPKKLSFKENVPSPLTSKSVVGTPKVLRFADSVKSLSSPTLPLGRPSPRRSPPSPRSLKDRSPTPEKISPKFAPRVDHLSPRKQKDADDEEDIEVDVDDDITFNFNRSQRLQEGSEEEVEAMVTDSDKAADLDVDAETEEDVDMMEESSEEDEEAQGGGDLQDGTALLSSVVPELASVTSQSMQRSSQSQSFTQSSIKSRSPIHGQEMRVSFEGTATTLRGQTSSQSSSTGEEESETTEEIVTASTSTSTSTSTSVIQESTDPEPRLETPDSSPGDSPFPLPLVGVVDQSDCQMSPLRLQITPSSTDASVTVPIEKTTGWEIPVLQAQQETTPEKDAHHPLTVDTSQVENSFSAPPEPPSQVSPRVQTRSASKVTIEPLISSESDSLHLHLSPSGSPRKSLSTTQVSPAKSASVSGSPVPIPGSPHSTTSIPISPVPSRSPTRSNVLTISQAKLERLDSLEGRVTRSRSSRSVSPMGSLPPTPTRSKKISDVSVIEGSEMSAADETDITDMASDSDQDKVSSKKKPGRCSATRSSAAPVTPTRQSSRLREKEASRGSTPPPSPTASPSRGRSTPSRPPARSPARSPGRSPARATKASTQKPAPKNTKINELTEDTDMVTEPSFRFSEPVQLEREANYDAERPSTPIHSFIFSPPLTRSQTRRGSVDKMSDTSSEPGVIPAPPEFRTPVVEKPRKSRRGKKTYSVPQCSPTNSPLNLVSPLAESQASRKGSQSADTTVPSQNLRKKVLRPRKKFGGRVW